MKSEERREVLDRVVGGELSAEEADRLLVGDVPAVAGRNRFLMIKVRQGDKTNVDVRLPIGLAKIAKLFVPKRIDVNGESVDFDFDEIIRVVESEVTGNIVEVHQVDDETGEVTDVSIYLE
ncbi:MAG TPA: hypothetical protein VM054_10455 [bacterium]|nr:hypothetical protein [bacterium]